MREALRKWPIVTNGLLVGFVTGSGDILAQRLRNRHDHLVSVISVLRAIFAISPALFSFDQGHEYAPCQSLLIKRLLRPAG
jgi:hypothetical protein